MAITEGVNSFISEADFYSHLDTRLNAADYTYLQAIIEAGIWRNDIAEIFNGLRGSQFASITAALVAAGIDDYVLTDLQAAYDKLTAGKTSVQTRNLQALIAATQIIDQFDFIGRAASATQPLQWPRLGAIDRNGQSIPADTIPTGIKKATAELALILLRYDITDPQQQRHLFQLTMERIGETQSNYAASMHRKLPDFIMDLLRPFISDKSSYSAALIC